MKILINILSIVSLFALNQSYASAGEQKESISSSPIAIIVNSELYSKVKESIDQYLEDLKNEGHEVVFLEWDDKIHADVEDLRMVLKDYYYNQNLQGAVLIGRLPYIKVHIMNEEGPLDSYLMDFNDDNFIKDESIYSKKYKKITRVKDLQWNIWVSRIWAPDNGILFPGKSEVDLIKKYFEKNHLYRTCALPVPDLKIEFQAGEIGWSLKSVSGDAEDYLKLLSKNPAQFLGLDSHSDSISHTFSNNEELYSSTIARVENKQPFLLLNACSACKFTDSQSLGNAYLFNENSQALVIAGLAVSGNLVSGYELETGNGKIFGNNFIDTLNTQETLEQHFAKLGCWVIKIIFENIIWALIGSEETWQVEDSAKINEMLAYADIHINMEYSIAFLGDPTLKSYSDMEWCPKYVDDLINQLNKS